MGLFTSFLLLKDIGPAISWGLCGFYGRAHHRDNALSPCVEVPQTSFGPFWNSFWGDQEAAGERLGSARGVSTPPTLRPTLEGAGCVLADGGCRPAPTTCLSKLPGSVNRHFALRILCRPMSQSWFALNTLSQAKQWLGARECRWSARNRAQGMKKPKRSGGRRQEGGRNQRQGWCRRPPQARGCVQSSGLRRPPRGRDFRDGKRAALPKEAGDFIGCYRDLLVSVGCGRVPGALFCVWGTACFGPAARAVSAAGAPGHGLHRPWMWEGDAGSSTEPELRIQNVPASSSTLPPALAVSQWVPSRPGPRCPWRKASCLASWSLRHFCDPGLLVWTSWPPDAPRPIPHKPPPLVLPLRERCSRPPGGAR